MRGILVEMPFAHFFLRRVLGKLNHLNDLQSLDMELYNRLVEFKTVTNVEAYDLTFAIDTRIGNHVRAVNLIPDGENIPVTKDNRVEYVNRVADFRLNREMGASPRFF